MFCFNCKETHDAVRSRKPGSKLLICPNCGYEIKLCNDMEGELRILARVKDGVFAPITDDDYYCMVFVNEYLTDEGTDILAYSEEEVTSNWVIPKGAGKSHGIIRDEIDIVKWGEVEIYQNIPFIDGKYPPRVHYIEELGEFLYEAFQILKEHPKRRFLLVIDEFAQFLNQHESGTRAGRVVAKLLDLTRKVGVTIEAICPNKDSFPITLERNSRMYLIKSPDRVVKLRKETGRMDIHPETITFIEGSTRLGWVRAIVELGQCAWTRPGGEYQYDHQGAGDFYVSQWLIDHRREFVQCLKFSGAKRVEAVLNLLGQYYSQEAKDRRAREEGTGKIMTEREMMRISVCYLVRKMIRGDDRIDIRTEGKDGKLELAKKWARLTPASIARICGASAAFVSKVITEEREREMEDKTPEVDEEEPVDVGLEGEV